MGFPMTLKHKVSTQSARHLGLPVVFSFDVKLSSGVHETL